MPHLRARPHAPACLRSFAVVLAGTLLGLPVLPAPAAPQGEVPAPPTLRHRRTMAVDVLEGKARRAGPQAWRFEPPGVATAIPNVRVNDPAGEVPNSGNTQMEPSLAASGDTLVCTFSDSKGLWGSGTVTGFSVSFDGGGTWFDAGSLPRAGTTPTEMVYGDPSVATDGVGRWYCVSVYDVGNGVAGQLGDLGLVLHTGRFVGSTLVWSGPRLVAGGGQGDVLDSPQLAIDRANDRLYVAYTDLGAAVPNGEIEVLTIGNHGTTNLHTAVVQPQVPGVNNAGTRVAVGPDGEVHCVWESDLWSLANWGLGPAKQLASRSLDLGATFSPPVQAGSVIASFFSGPPGFNREEEFVEFPSIAVDRSNGPFRGRVYLAWHDGAWRDFSGALTPVAETAAWNDSPLAAQLLTPAGSQWEISGAVPSGDLVDWYRFSGAAGEHLRFVLDPAGYCRLRARLYCGNPGGGADTLLAGSERRTGDHVFFLFTLPTTGDYYIEVSRWGGSGSAYSAYLRRTSTATPSPGIDHRDIVVASSPDGVSGWSTTKVRVDDDVDWTDQAMPAVVVDGDGGVHVVWYDRRFDPRCRARADLMLASSFDGGTTFTPNVRVTSLSSSWQVPADAIPNFGDQFWPLADGARLFLVWADGRLGSPDVYVAPLRTDFVIAVPPSVSGVSGLPLALEVDVRNDTPYDDARFTVTIDAGFPELPDTSLVVGPLARGAAATALYAPLVGAWINVPATRTLDVRVVSDRSAAVREASAALVPGSVDVGLADFAAAPAAGGIQLRWRAARDARFHVERAVAAPGPFVRLTPSPVGALRGDRFEFVDAGVRPGERVFYRLIGLGAAGEVQVFGPWAATAAAPAAVALLGAQPNPFNPTTAIRFELPRDADVTLRILDVRGREVATLLAGAHRAAGEHAVLWDGRSASGTPQASGVYVAELRALGTRRTQRLVLLR